MPLFSPKKSHIIHSVSMYNIIAIRQDKRKYRVIKTELTICQSLC